jgi:segregation and condensation protein B
LFASDKPTSLATLKQAFAGTTVDTKTLKKALEELQVICADPSRGVSLEEVNGGWQFRTKLDNMEFLKKIAKVRPFKLSGPALEVLSIIAYKQPIIKNEVDQIRGVESGHLVRALMEKGLVSFAEKTDLPGKPMAYQTTRKFLEIFGLRNLHELPTLSEIDDLLPEGIGDEEEKETLSDVTSEMSQNYTGNYSEGEEELLKISERSARSIRHLNFLNKKNSVKNKNATAKRPRTSVKLWPWASRLKRKTSSGSSATKRNWLWPVPRPSRQPLLLKRPPRWKKLLWLSPQMKKPAMSWLPQSLKSTKRATPSKISDGSGGGVVSERSPVSRLPGAHQDPTAKRTSCLVQKRRNIAPLCS